MHCLKKENRTRRKFVKEIAGAVICGAWVTPGATALSAWIAEQNANEGEKVLQTGTGIERLVAVCGLNCGACPMYRATQSKDEEKRSALLEQFSSGPTELTTEDLQCDGCLGNNRMSSFCRSCDIRLCPADKPDVTRCSDCPDFPCSRITNFNNDGMLHHAEVLGNIRQIRELGIQEWAKYDAARWRCPQCIEPISWYDSKCSACGAARSERLFPLSTSI